MSTRWSSEMCEAIGSAGERRVVSGEAFTAYETIATMMAASKPTPRPCLTVLPVGYSTQYTLRAYVFALTKSRRFPWAAFGVRFSNKPQSQVIVEEAKGSPG